MNQVVSKVVDKVATKKSLKGGPKLWGKRKQSPKNPHKIFPAIQKKTQNSQFPKQLEKRKKNEKHPGFCFVRFRDDPPHCNLFPIPHGHQRWHRHRRRGDLDPAANSEEDIRWNQRIRPSVLRSPWLL